MDWIQLESLRTVAGAALAVTLIVAAAKAFVPALTGRATQIVALVVSLVIGAVIGSWSNATAVLLTLINSVVIFAAAMGFDQAANYRRGT